MQNTYKIATYKLSNKYTDILKNYFFNSCLENFEIIEIDDFKNDDISPDILLIDSNTPITNEIKTFVEKNLTKIVKTTSIPISAITTSNLILSFSEEYVESVFLDYNKKLKHIEYSLESLKNIIKSSNRARTVYFNNLLKSTQKKYVYKTLIKLIYFIDTRDHYTKKHSQNVANYAVLLGKYLNLSDKELDLLKLGGMLHDIGKLGIPENILMKTGPLTDDEFNIIKNHTLIGESILPDMGYEDLKSIIRSHHERIDGNGYPDHLKGDEITYYAKIISIADTFDAMTTQRSYNKRRTLKEALDELLNSSKPKFKNGKLDQQLDSQLVNAFIQAIKADSTIVNRFSKEDKEIIDTREKNKVFQKDKKRF